MLTLFWGCLAGGALFAIVSVVLGDLISQVFDGLFDFLSVDFLQPMVLATAITTFGGAGILLTEYTFMSSLIVIILSIVFAIALSAIVYFGYVKPMQNSENSTGFSVRELSGKVGQVTVSIPPQGYGEVIIRVGAGHTNQIAASFDRQNIPEGAQVVVVEVKEHVLYVSQLTI